MSRRRVIADATFAGSVHISLRPEYLTAFWEEIASSIHGLRVVVLRADGRLIARWPGNVQAGAAVPPNDPLMQRIAAGEGYGHHETASPFDGEKRLVAFRKLGQYPLYIAAAFNRAQIVAGWAARVALLALFVVPLAGALVWMAWVALKRTREELDAVQRLEEETARRSRTELALVQSQKLEALGQLAGGVAHDFNNLLMIVASNLHLLRRRIAHDAEHPLLAIERAVGTGTRLTRQLLALSGRQALAPERVVLQERLPALLALVRAALPRSIELESHVAPDTAAIFVDVAELELALVNLALNARDAMEGGGRLLVTARNAGEQVVLEVTDTGHGIDPAIIGRVLEPFYTTKPAGKGNGLGLTQVQALSRSAGGKVEIVSSPGNGTRVQLYFARAAADAGSEHQGGAARPAADLDCALLLVEDNDALAQATAAVLESFGCRVRRVENARAALKALDEERFDVVLSDIEMPGRIDGIELALQLARRAPALPVLLMSGYATRIEQAKAAGLEVLTKPCSPVTLRDAIAGALGSRFKPAARASA
jgi:two-component system NtrC family sensor kinase